MGLRTALGWLIFWVLLGFELSGASIVNPIYFAAGFFIVTVLYDALSKRGDEKQARRNLVIVGVIAGICLWGIIDNANQKREFVAELEKLCLTSPFAYDDMVNRFCDEANSIIENYLYSPERDRDPIW